MAIRLRVLSIGAAWLVLLLTGTPRRIGLMAQAPTPSDVWAFSAMRWRQVGPFRGGRTTTIAGVVADPRVFYAGAAGGGVWKTLDAGQHWRPVFDDQVTGSIGAIAVAPTDANVVYVGTGAPVDGHSLTAGTGLYRSGDGGQTWTHLGLSDSQHIARVIVDPRNKDHLFVAVAGSPTGPSDTRGIFRSTNGGRAFVRVLFVDANLGAADVAFDAADPDTVYASLWHARLSPWDDQVFNGPGGGVYRSTDGGTTWQPMGRGLPSRLGRVALATAPGARVFALVESTSGSGLYGSTDAGATWTFLSSLSGPPTTATLTAGVAFVRNARGDESLIVTGAEVSRSVDGGRTFVPWQRDPTGAHYAAIWIHPSNGDVIAVAGSRGAIITVNGGATWSAADNLPTADLEQIATDNAFPYRVCGADRDQPPGCLPSRGDGAVPAADWRPVGLPGSRDVVPDPTDADVIYSGLVGRYDRRTGQLQGVPPPSTAGDRGADRAPLAFAPTDARTLYYGTTRLWKTSAGGQTWTEISPDLTRDAWEMPANLSGLELAARAARRRGGSVSSIGPSPVDGRVIWAGTDDGLIHVTRDGGSTWTAVTPPRTDAWAAVEAIEPSRFDSNTAYAAIDARRLNDAGPRLWRTRDSGATWVDITRGLPTEGLVSAVREDPFRRGLLFAATEHSVFVSFDDGDHWRSLRLNLPGAPVGDLTVREADVVIATHGRGAWILDDIAPLRQMTADVARASAFLFRPSPTWRIRAGLEAGPPVEGPAGANPTDGGVFYYVLGSDLEGPVTIEIIETISGQVIRRWSSDAGTAADRLAATPGLHRVGWDLKFTPVDGRGVTVLPGTYQVRLTIGARFFRQAVIVRMDPRARATAADLAAQFKTLTALNDARRAIAAVQRPLGDSGPAASLDAAMRALTASFDEIQQADLKPTAASDTAAQRAIDQATAVVTATR